MICSKQGRFMLLVGGENCAGKYSPTLGYYYTVRKRMPSCENGLTYHITQVDTRALNAYCSGLSG